MRIGRGSAVQLAPRSFTLSLASVADRHQGIPFVAGLKLKLNPPFQLEHSVLPALWNSADSISVSTPLAASLTVSVPLIVPK